MYRQVNIKAQYRKLKYNLIKMQTDTDGQFSVKFCEIISLVFFRNIRSDGAEYSPKTGDKSLDSKNTGTVPNIII